MLSRLDPWTRRLLLRVPLTGILATVLWFIGIGGAYSRRVIDATEATLRLFERPPVTFLHWENGSISVRRSDFSTRSGAPNLDPDPITANLVLLLALVFATPGVSEKNALLRALAAFAGLFASHVAHLALTIETLYATKLGPWSQYAYTNLQREILSSVRYFFDIALTFAMPFLLWGVLLLLPAMRRREAAAAEPARPGRSLKAGKRKRR